MQKEDDDDVFFFSHFFLAALCVAGSSVCVCVFEPGRELRPLWCEINWIDFRFRSLFRRDTLTEYLLDWPIISHVSRGTWTLFVKLSIYGLSDELLQIYPHALRPELEIGARKSFIKCILKTYVNIKYYRQRLARH